jgi:hypothetical protein
MPSLLFELAMLSEFLMRALKGNKKAAALHSIQHKGAFS